MQNSLESKILIYIACHAGKLRIMAGSPACKSHAAQQSAAPKPVPSAGLKANKLGGGIANALQALIAAVPENEVMYLQQLLFMCNTVANYLVFLFTNFPADAQGSQATQGDPYSCTFAVPMSMLHKFALLRQLLLNDKSLSSSFNGFMGSEPGLLASCPAHLGAIFGNELFGRCRCTCQCCETTHCAVHWSS